MHGKFAGYPVRRIDGNHISRAPRSLQIFVNSPPRAEHTPTGALFLPYLRGELANRTLSRSLYFERIGQTQCQSECNAVADHVQDTMKADQMQSRSWYQRGQALHEFHRCHHVVAGAVAPRRLELQHLSSTVQAQALVGNRRAGDVTAQLLQPLPVTGCATHPCVQAEPVGVGAQRRGFTTSRRSARGELQAQHLLSRARALRDAVVGGGRLQGRHHVIWIDEATRQIRLALLLDEMTEACQQSQEARDDLGQ